jgi:hypothetical protein
MEYHEETAAHAIVATEKTLGCGGLKSRKRTKMPSARRVGIGQRSPRALLPQTIDSKPDSHQLFA